MKMRNYLFFILLWFFAFTSQGLANDLVLGRAELATIFTEVVTAETPWPIEDLEVNNFSAIPSQVTLPLGKVGYEILSIQPARLLGQKTVSLLITIDGKPQAQVKMHGELARYGNVIISNRRLPRHTIIAPEDLAVARRNLTMFAHDLVQNKDEAIGQRLTTNLRSGAILYSRNLKKTPLVQRGDMVTIQARHNNILVAVKGEARDQGAKGDSVKVKNLMSRRIILARVVESGVVEVDF